MRASAVLPLDLKLVLWPEDVVDVDGALAGSDQESALSSLAARLRTTVVAGVVEDVDPDRFFNAAVAWGPDGKVIARYDKVHRVPFGEYVPARTFFDRLADLSDVPRDAIPGRGAGVLETGVGRLGVLVSYEVFFEGRARDAVRADAAILLVPTNASSYRDAQVPAQEVAAARLRAIQTGRWVLQAAPTGYSVVVDHDGRVLQSSPLGLPSVLRGTVQLRSGDTPWTVIGSVPVMAVAGLGLLLGLLVNRRQIHRTGAA
jgi:apolipoprotein N-acyltransferase